MNGESTCPATMSTSPATHISRKAILLKRKMQLRKSLAAKAKGGGKVASMVQKLQKHHTEEEDASDNSLLDEAVTGGADEPPMFLSVSSAQSDFQPPPPPPPPPPPLPKSLMPEQISAHTGTSENLAPPTVEQEDVELNVRSYSLLKEQDVDADSESLSTAQTASTHSTYTSLSTLTGPNSASKNNVAPEVQAEDMEKLQSEKNHLHAKLQAYEADFVATHGREVETYQDLEPVAPSYRRYLTVKKEVAQRSKKKVSTKSGAENSRSPHCCHSSEGASLSSPLDVISEAGLEQEETTEEGDVRGLGGPGALDDSNTGRTGRVHQRNEYIGFESRKAAAVTNNPTGQAMQKKNKKKAKRGGSDSDTDTVVAAVAAILDNDKRNKVGDPGDIILTDDSSSNASEPGRIIASSATQPFDEVPPGDEIMPNMQPRRQRRGLWSNETTPERSNKAKGRKALAYNKGSPAGVASLSAEETPRRLGASSVLSSDDDLPEAEGPPPILSVVSSASSSGILHLSEAGSPAPPPVSFRSSSRTVPMASPWSACLADDASLLSAQFTTSIGSADDFDNDTYCTPAIVRIRQTATCSRNVPRSKQQHRSITDMFTCKPRDEDIKSIDSEGPPAMCKSDVCKAPTPGSKPNPYTSKPMPIDEANSFIVNINEKNAVEKEEEQMTDITFPSFPEVETWSNMVDDMMKTLEEDVASAKDTMTSLPDQSQNSDPCDNIASAKLIADASASNLTLAMEELDSLKAEFDGISKELTLSNDRLKQLEKEVEEREQTIATLQLERDLAQADVKHLQDKISRLEKESKEANAITRRKMKQKDAQIALLNNTIEKLKQELDAAKERATKTDNVIRHHPPTILSITGNHASHSIPKTITPNTQALKDRSLSPLHPDDELDNDFHNKSIDQPIQYELTELSLLTMPHKPDQKSRAIDICRRKNRLTSESSISISSNGLELSETSSSLEEALEFVRTFSANLAIGDECKKAQNDDISATEERCYEAGAIPITGDNSKEESSSIRHVEPPRKEVNEVISGEKEERSEIGNECADLATEYCCIQEASELINKINDDWCDEKTNKIAS